MYGSLSLGGTFQGWDVLRTHLLHFGTSADAFKITAAMGDVKDLPVPIVLSYEQGWYTDDSNPSFDHRYFRGGVGVRTLSLFAPNDVFSMGVQVDAMPFVVEGDLVAPNSLGVPESQVSLRSELGVTFRHGCFGGEYLRGCVNSTFAGAADYSLNDPLEFRYQLNLAVEHGRMSDLKNPPEHWSRSILLGGAAAFGDVVYLRSALLGGQLGSVPGLADQRMNIDLLLSPLIASAQGILLNHTGDKSLYYFLPCALIVFMGTTESILAGVEISEDPLINGALEQTGIKNIVLGANMAASKLLSEKLDVSAWGSRLVVGLALSSVFMGMEVAGAGDSNTNFGVINGALGSIIGGTF